MAISRCRPQGDDLIVYHTEEFHGCTCHATARGSLSRRAKPREWLRFKFPRQEGRRRLCISDFFRDQPSGQFDVLGIQLVTVGDRATEVAEKLRAANQYQDYLYLHGFGVESRRGPGRVLAQADAAGVGILQRRRREDLGSCSSRDIVAAATASGIPRAPTSSNATKIVELLSADAIGVMLSENYMLVPEQSTDALVVHHPQAKYFDV